MSESRKSIVVPCIDIQDGKVVQLVQGRTKALEGPDPLEMIERFAGFEEIQVIDLDAAMGVGDNAPIIEMLASRAKCLVGGGVRTPERAAQLLDLGAHRVIVERRRLLLHIQRSLNELKRKIFWSHLILSLAKSS